MNKLKPFSKLALAIGLGIILLMPLIVSAANLLTNDGLEPPFDVIGSYTGPGNIVWDQKVAQGWHEFMIDSPNRLRYFSSSDWAAFNSSGVVEKRDGLDAQVWWTPRENDNGIYQQISGLTIGEVYGFQAGILQVFETTGSTDPHTGKMLRSVGIDPTGGTDPEAPSVIWGPAEGTATYTDPGTSDKYTWFYPGVGAQAISTTVTVFARVQINEDAGPLQSNQVWVDDTFFDIAPTTSLTLTATSPTQVRAEWHGEPRTDFSLYAYEAQYRKASDSAWTDLQIFTVQTTPSTNEVQTFPVESGVEYIVRARTWHEEVGSDSHEVPGPWIAQSIVAGGVVYGTVTDNQALPINGVTVSLTNAATSTVSGMGGSYSLEIGAGTFAVTATTTAGWHALDPISVSTTITQAVGPIKFTLSPPDNFVVNGGLEGTFTGWTDALSGTGFDAPRSGGYSLIITGSGTLSQSGSVNTMYRPVLSFWHKIENANASNSLVVQIAGAASPGSLQTAILPATPPLVITQTTLGWQHVSLPLILSSTNTYSGSLSVQFVVNQASLTPTTFYLDEVTFGSSWGGVNSIYMPLIFK